MTGTLHFQEITAQLTCKKDSTFHPMPNSGLLEPMKTKVLYSDAL